MRIRRHRRYVRTSKPGRQVENGSLRADHGRSSADRGGRRIVVAVVEDDREEPAVPRSGYAIAIADAFQMAGRAGRLPMDLSHGRHDRHEVLALVP